jgi:primosomal protein N'
MCIVRCMKCIQVLPILKHTFSEELTYWTTHDFQIGDLIQVELNHRNIYAVVSSIVSLSEAKEFIKSRDFKIKKIETYTKVDFFSSAFIKACLEVSKHYVRSFGEVLSEYIPKKVLEGIGEREVITKTERLVSKNKTSPSPLYIQKQFSERIEYIKELQNTYTHICIIVPTDAYKKHIQLHLNDLEHITILTPINLHILDEKDFDVCILEYAGSEYYRHMRKGFDSRHMIRTYCNLSNMQLIEMDSILPTYKDISVEDIQTGKIKNTPEIHVIDQTVSKTAKVQRGTSKILKKDRPEDDVDFRHFFENNIDIITHKKLKLISPELYSLIVYAEKEKEDILIYTTRKGLSSSVVCSDCKHTPTCDTCKKPITLTEKKGVRSYTCPNGHATVSIDSTCTVCGSIHLQTLGAGTEALETELRDVVPMPIVVIDGNSVTQAAARNIFKKRKEKNHTPTIYIGTELALHQSLDEYFTYSAIASLETFFAIPSPIAELEAARIIEALREKTTDTLVIQTRTPKHIVWSYLQNKTWRELTNQVQKDTQELKLPPYTTHIQLYIAKKTYTAEHDTKAIQDYIRRYPNLITHHMEDTMRHVIHLYIDAWLELPEHQSLHRYIKSLPKHVHVEVDSPTLM